MSTHISPTFAGRDEADGASGSAETNEDVVALAAQLASRQAASAQRPRQQQPVGVDASTSAQSSGDGGRPGNMLLGVGGGASGSSSAQTSPTLRRVRSRMPDYVGQPRQPHDSDAPKIDEEAIYAVTGRVADGEAIEDDDETAAGQEDGDGRRLSASLHSLRGSRSRLSIKPGSGEDDAAERKRMTVVMDEEMPSEEENDGSQDGGTQSLASSRADRDDGKGEAHTRAQDVPEERDADTGEGGVEARDTTEACQSTALSAKEEETPAMADLAQSMATLRTGHLEQSRHSADDDIAHREAEHSRGGTRAGDEDEEDDEEPSLKYSRLRGSVPDMLKRDAASALAVSDRFLALGTHGGSVYILDEQGNLIKGFRTHSASVLALDIDSTNEFVGSAGMDGLVSVAGLSSSESYTFDFKRVMRSISLEPGFGRRSTRSIVCGGMAGQLVLREKSWFGHREVIVHEGEGPIWTTQWRGNLIAWANDKGVRIYDTASKQRITFIAPPDDNPRADLFRCTLFWQDDATLLIAWADTIKVAKVRNRDQSRKVPGTSATSSLAVASASGQRLVVEITAILQLDCMISGLAPRGSDYLILAYITDDDEAEDESSSTHKRREGQRPELRLISQDGEEMSSDVLSLQSFARFQCNDYLLVPSADARLSGAAAIAPKVTTTAPIDEQGDYFYVVSPKDIVVARSRDQSDHIDWLLQHRHYEEALTAVQGLGPKAAAAMGFDANVIGARFLTYLVHDRQDWPKAASVAPLILKDNVQAWEDVVFAFAERQALAHLIDRIPYRSPTLSSVVYDMILAHLLRVNTPVLLDTIRMWPVGIYSAHAVILALEDRLQQGETATPEKAEGAEEPTPPNEEARTLMECLAEIHLRSRQPGKALQYYMRLRKPGVFDLVREHNLFTVVQDQALLLIEFEQDLRRKAAAEGESADQDGKPWQSIELLVDHTHSIPIQRVVPQLQAHRTLLFLYLDALFDRDPQLIAPYSDTAVELYAECAYGKLMAYLRTMSSHYSFEKAYNVCRALDYVPEMVFLLSRIGDNKTALMLIIERLGDVERAIEFVKEEKDPELWDNLVHYSEDKPNFIRGLLENVGGEVDAVKLIRRIKNGLQIEGLRGALIRILGDFNLQSSLLEGCAAILANDGRSYAQLLYRGQHQGLYCDAEMRCSTCNKRLFARTTEGATRIDRDGEEEAEDKSDGAAVAASSKPASDLRTDESVLATNAILFLCRHAHHLTCLVANTASIPKKQQASGNNVAAATNAGPLVSMTTTRALASGARHAAGTYGPMQRASQHRAKVQDKIRYQARLRVVLKRGCPLCHSDREQFRL